MQTSAEDRESFYLVYDKILERNDKFPMNSAGKETRKILIYIKIRSPASSVSNLSSRVRRANGRPLKLRFDSKYYLYRGITRRTGNTALLAYVNEEIAAGAPGSRRDAHVKVANVP